MEGDTEFKFEMYCVMVKEQDDVEKTSLLNAHQILVNDGLEPFWKEEEACMKVKERNKNCVYIMSCFRGAAFEHLTQLNCRVLGPQCVLSCICLKVEIPRTSQPLLNMAMKDLVINCTSIDKDSREVIHTRVRQMAGEITKDLTARVTHLVAGEVGSEKYRVAGGLGKTIMLKEWVNGVWNEAKSRHVIASDEEFNKYKFPIFHKLVVCVSGLNLKDRKHVQAVVEGDGGSYSGDMVVNQCTHLILNEAKGQKYECARRWQIFTVSPQWLYDSVDRGYCLAESDYKISGSSKQSFVKTSTPERTMSVGHISGMSDISCINMSNISNINETTMANNSTMIQPETNAILNFDLTQVSSNQPLDGCKIYLSGFSMAEIDKLKRLVNLSGATRFGQISENTTHIVMGTKIEADITTLNNLSHRPKTVTSGWLMECCKRGVLLPTSDYQPSHMPPSPSVVDKKAVSNRKTYVDPNDATLDEDDDGLQEMMSQYLLPPPPPPGENMGEATLAAVNAMSTSTLDPNEPEISVRPPNHTTQDMMVAMASTMDTSTQKDVTLQDAANMSSTFIDTQVPATQEGTAGRAFHKKLFVIVGFDDDQREVLTEYIRQFAVFHKNPFVVVGFDDDQREVLTEYIRQFAGKVVGEKSRAVPDYAVVPLCGYPVEMTVQEVVTNAWIQMCVETETFLPLDTNELFRPLDVVMDAEPLTGTVLSISGFSGTERDCLMKIAELMGATCQEYFVRKANKGLEASSHLITKLAEGTKYLAAKKWGIPALSKRWLLDCSTSGKRLPEDGYDIDKMADMTSLTESTMDQSNKTTHKPSETTQKPQENHDKIQQRSTNLLHEQKSNYNNSRQSLQNIQQKATKSPNMRNRLSLAAGKNTTNMPPPNFIDKITPINENENYTNIKRQKYSDTTENNRPTEMNMVQTSDVHFTAPMSPPKSVASVIPQKSPHRSDMQSRKAEISSRSTEIPSRSKTTSEPIADIDMNGMDFSSSSIFTEVDGEVNKLPLQDCGSRRSIMQEQKVSNDDNYVETTTTTKLSPPPTSTSSQKENNQVVTPMMARSKHKRVKELQAPSPVAAGPRSPATLASLGIDSPSVFLDPNKSFHPHFQVDDFLKSLESPSDFKKPQQTNSPSLEELFSKNLKECVEQSRQNESFEALSQADVQGRANDTSKEFRTARDSGKLIVHPHWLLTCREDQTRVDEGSFPHSYNPQKTLSVLTGKGATPRSTKRSTRSTPHGQTPHTRPTTTTTTLPKVKLLFEEEPEVVPVVPTTTALSVQNELAMQTETQDVDAALNQLESVMDNSKCMCTECVDTPTNTEMVCCQESPKAKVKLHDLDPRDGVQGHLRCITHHPGFGAVCLNRHVLDAAYNQYRTMYGNYTRKISNASGTTSSDESRGSAKKPIPQEDDGLKDGGKKDIEPSQSVKVTWDDTMSRKECDKLASQISRACSPPPVILEEAQEAQRSPTPDPPNIGGPLTSPTEPLPPAIISKPPPIFLLSGMQEQERVEYGALVEGLGGRVMDGQYYHNSCSHLVVGGNPTRNEKFLACVSAGKWVLHRSYLEACRSERAFAEEEEHEWGGSGTEGVLHKCSPQVVKLAKAAHRWRKRIHTQIQDGVKRCGAFRGWDVILCTDKQKEGNFRRLLEAGGAKVVSTRPPFPKDCTHCFIDVHKVKFSDSELQGLIHTGVNCYKPEYIAAYLTDEPPPDGSDYCPPEISALRASMDEGNKRKSTMETSMAKRTRRK